MYVMPGDRAGRKRLLSVPFFVATRNKIGVNATRAAHSWKVFQNTDTDIDLVLSPKGVGGIAGNLADGTILGGNKRATYSIDLQLAPRTAANQVAGGASIGTVLIGGRRNSIRNTAAGTSDYSAIVGGDGNYMDSSSGAAGIGNFIGGGVGVTIDQSAGGGSRASIGGNTIAFTGDASYAANVGGVNVAISAQGAVNLGGRQVINGFDHASTFGRYVKSRAIASLSIGTGNASSTIGASQFSVYPIGCNTSTATPTDLTTDYNGANLLNRPCGVIGVSEVVGFNGLAVCNTNGTLAGLWRIEGLLMWVAGVLTLVVNTCTNVFLSAGLAGATLILSVDAVNKQLQVIATGIALTTINWTGFIFANHRI